jgi:hypothetical protein
MTPAAVRRWQQECERSGADCAARVEAVALRQPWSRALRRGAALTIYTLDGEVGFMDDDSAGSCYRYLGMLDPGGLHLVGRRSRAELGFLTVSDRGRQQTLFDDLTLALQPQTRMPSEFSFAR